MSNEAIVFEADGDVNIAIQYGTGEMIEQNIVPLVGIINKEAYEGNYKSLLELPDEDVAFLGTVQGIPILVNKNQTKTIRIYGVHVNTTMEASDTTT